MPASQNVDAWLVSCFYGLLYLHIPILCQNQRENLPKDIRRKIKTSYYIVTGEQTLA